jgi:DNA-binding NarL/FixJ family response regulator
MKVKTKKMILSLREYEVMEMVSSGMLNKEIADKISRKEDTVKKHLRHIFPKLDAQNRIEASNRFRKLKSRLKYNKAV